MDRPALLQKRPASNDLRHARLDERGGWKSPGQRSGITQQQRIQGMAAAGVPSFFGEEATAPS